MCVRCRHGLLYQKYKTTIESNLTMYTQVRIYADDN